MRLDELLNRKQLTMIVDNEIIVDVFAGGGGASEGIRRALGRSPDVCINHDAAAIAMHEANHAESDHVLEDVWKAGPHSVTRGRPVGLLWASPDCKHFSRAKGSKPVEKRIRSLAWVVVKWAVQERPRVIILENVREFAEWGPLVPAWKCQGCKWRGTEGQAKLIRTRRRCPRCDSAKLQVTSDMIPDPDRKGLTFKRWAGRLRNLGYKVEWKNLNAADFGAPTHRRRLFLIARCDGLPIVWPEPTHGDPKKLNDMPLFGRLKPWRTAAECIEWSLPVPSIFDRKRPLADATMRRIAMGIKRYVLENPQPFIVGVGGRMGQTPAAGVDQPSNTVTAKNDRALVTPYLVPVTHTGDRRSNRMDDPLPTVTGAHRGEFALIAPTLIGAGGSAYAAKPRSANEPLNTVMQANRQAVVAAFLAKHFGGVVGVPIDTPLPTATSIPTQNQIVTATLVQTGYGEREGQSPRAIDIEKPLGTVVAGGSKHGLVAANLIHLNHGEKQWSGVDEPARTVTSGNHAALVYSFLVKYFGTAIGQHLIEPLHTVTSKDRFGLVTVTINGEPYVIVDIGMRMLTPRELARAQGFGDGYILTGTKTSQVARLGNSVPPVMAKVLVEANFIQEPVAV